MTKKIIGLGTTPNDHAGDSIRVAGGKINDNFNELYTALGNGTTLGVALIATSGNYSDLSNKPLTIVPTTSTTTGTPGQYSYDANYFYVCVATNVWKRTALTTW
jgi:hypothetical protein